MFKDISFAVPIILMITWIGKLVMTMGHHALIITDSVTFPFVPT
jgi:hypothetical protein